MSDVARATSTHAKLVSAKFDPIRAKCKPASC